MSDWYLLLAPVALLAVVVLLRFVGCYNPVQLDPGILADNVQVNCGGQVVVEDVTFAADDGDGGTSGDRFKSTGGTAFKLVNSPPVVDQAGNGVSAVYGT